MTSYLKINNSFKSKIIYHFGSEAGFFSEYNNMVLAILYCLKHKIKFTLYSDDAIFKIKLGWQDFFLPFCNESKNRIHSIINFRQLERKLSLREKTYRYLFRLIERKKYLTFEIWDKFHSKEFEKEYFNIPELGIEGNLKESCKKIVDLTWRFNSEIEDRINSLKNSLDLPQKYIGIHIRRGDKLQECNYFEIRDYINTATKYSNSNDIFIATDDYNAIIEIKNMYPNWNIYSLCPEHRKGYFQNEFNILSIQNKKNEIIELLATVEILSEAEHFVGTLSSNIGMFIGMRIPMERLHGVDSDHWGIW